jgi:hypothetical protein
LFCRKSGKAAEKSRLSGAGRPLLHKDLDDRVYEFVLECRRNKKRVSRRLIQIEALKIGQDMERKGELESDQSQPALAGYRSSWRGAISAIVALPPPAKNSRPITLKNWSTLLFSSENNEKFASIHTDACMPATRRRFGSIQLVQVASPIEV